MWKFFIKKASFLNLLDVLAFNFLMHTVVFSLVSRSNIKFQSILHKDQYRKMNLSFNAESLAYRQISKACYDFQAIIVNFEDGL